MKRIVFVPGAIVTPNPITIPTGAPDIDSIVAAEITRLPSGMAIPDHAAADVQASTPINDHPAADIQASAPINDHPVHAHDFITQGVAGAPANAIGLDAALTALEDAGAAALHTVPGAGATGVQNNAAAQVHAFGAGVVTTHAFGAGVVTTHGFGAGVALAHGASTGADPVVAATATRLTTRTISLNVSTLLGDVLLLDYLESGERVATS